MGVGQNQSAIQLWEQIFSRMAASEFAALIDPNHDYVAEEKRMRLALAEAGWSPTEIEARVQTLAEQIANAPITSAGVNPHVEFMYSKLCDDVENAMRRLKLDTANKVGRGIEPRGGVHAAKTNVIMTDESIVTVGAFTFRFCGLVARAFTRTLYLNPYIWETPTCTVDIARQIITSSRELQLYWVQIFLSFAWSGTNAMVPYKPGKKHEVLLLEQIARGMEVFAIAHEYGHHHLNHGRNIEDDPKMEEFAADQFALKISREVAGLHETPIENPYLHSGAGGVILLYALKILSRTKDILSAQEPMHSTTHPEVLERIAKFDTVALLNPQKFIQWQRFRTVANLVMMAVEAEMLEALQTMPTDFRAHLYAGTLRR